MKKAHLNSLLIALAVWVLLLGGCKKSDAKPELPEVEVELNGVVGDYPVGRGVLIPAPGGLPPTQLTIGVVSVISQTTDPANNTPTENDWNGLVAWRRAYFGGIGLGANPVTNGEIKFTSADGSVTQKIFYEATGSYYFFKAVYPYSSLQVTPTVDGGSVAFPSDGSNDIMCTGLAWGNKDIPTVQTLTFKHLLTKLNFKLKAESASAITEYGQIQSVELVYQPDNILLNIYEEAVYPGSLLEHSYSPVNSITPAVLTTSAVDFGYVMAIPSENFTLRIVTEKRLAFYVDIPFNVSPFTGMSLPGTAYNITFVFKQSDEIEIYAEEALEWTMDSTFD